MIRVLVADPYRAVAQAFAVALAAEGDFVAVGTCRTVDRVLAVARKRKPHVVLSAPHFPDGSAFEAAERLRQQSRARFVILTPERSAAFAQRAAKLGLHHVAASRPLFEVAEAVRRATPAHEVRAPAPQLPPPKRGRGPEVLTERQIEVIRLAARGRSVPRMARELGLTQKGVESHLYRIANRLGVRGRVQLAVFAVRHGLVTL